MLYQLLALSAILSPAICDYLCVCNYNVEKEVYPQNSTGDLPLGYMYEFDCKPVAGGNTTGDWVSISYKHQVGYVQMDSQTEVQTCPGEASTEDLLTSTAVSVTSPPSTVSTTVMDSTTSPTTQMSTSTSVVTTQPPTAQMSTTIKQSSTTMMTSTMSPSTSSTTPSTPAATSTVATTTTTVRDSTVPTSVLTTSANPMQTSSSEMMTSSSASSSMMTTTAIANMSVTYGCDSKYIQMATQDGGLLFTYGHYCYELVPVVKIWVEAEDDCQRRGGHLAHIANADEQNVIHQMVETYHGDHGIWIGLHDKNTEENFEWTSGDPVTYTNWDPTRKDPVMHPIEDCVGLGVQVAGYDGTWEDLRCGRELHYLCQFGAVPVEVTTPPPVSSVGYSDGDPSLCPLKVRQLAQQYGTTLVQHGDSCYELLHNKVTWQHAESLCQDAEGHLAQIGSVEEQNYVQAFMQKYNPDRAVWIGLHDLNVESNFEWTNGAPVGYTNWIQNHLDNFESHNTEDCIALIPYKGGVWDDIPCGDSILGFDIGEKHLSFCKYDITGSSSLGGVLVG